MDEEVVVHTVHNRWLPEDMHGLIWTTLEDVTALSKGDVIFDPAQYAHYAGYIDNITEANGKRFAVIRWVKSADNVINDCIPFSRMEHMLLWWADPCYQER